MSDSRARHATDVLFKTSVISSIGLCSKSDSVRPKLELSSRGISLSTGGEQEKKDGISMGAITKLRSSLESSLEALLPSTLEDVEQETTEDMPSPPLVLILHPSFTSEELGFAIGLELSSVRLRRSIFVAARFKREQDLWPLSRENFGWKNVLLLA